VAYAWLRGYYKSSFKIEVEKASDNSSYLGIITSMSPKSIIWLGMVAGSSIGGFVPSLWGADLFSIQLIIFSTIGGVVGIWLGYRFTR